MDGLSIMEPRQIRGDTESPGYGYGSPPRWEREKQKGLSGPYPPNTHCDPCVFSYSYDVYRYVRLS